MKRVICRIMLMYIFALLPAYAGNYTQAINGVVISEPDGIINNVSIVDNSRPTPSQEFAHYIYISNHDKELPSLEYWGFGDIQWSEVSSRSSKAQIQSRQGFAGISSVASLEASESGVITGYALDFAQTVKNREDRLNLFKQLKQRMIDEYGFPSHPLYPDNMVGGRDAYIAGVQGFYSIEWHGTETNVSLHLSDRNLTIRFYPTNPSSARLKTSGVKAVNDYIATERAKLMLNNVLDKH